MKKDRIQAFNTLLLSSSPEQKILFQQNNYKAYQINSPTSTNNKHSNSNHTHQNKHTTTYQSQNPYSSNTQTLNHHKKPHHHTSRHHQNKIQPNQSNHQKRTCTISLKQLQKQAQRKNSQNIMNESIETIGCDILETEEFDVGSKKQVKNNVYTPSKVLGGSSFKESIPHFVPPQRILSHPKVMLSQEFYVTPKNANPSTAKFCKSNIRFPEVGANPVELKVEYMNGHERINYNVPGTCSTTKASERYKVHKFQSSEEPSLEDDYNPLKSGDSSRKLSQQSSNSSLSQGNKGKSRNLNSIQNNSQTEKPRKIIKIKSSNHVRAKGKPPPLNMPLVEYISLTKAANNDSKTRKSHKTKSTSRIKKAETLNHNFSKKDENQNSQESIDLNKVKIPLENNESMEIRNIEISPKPKNPMTNSMNITYKINLAKHPDFQNSQDNAIEKLPRSNTIQTPQSNTSQQSMSIHSSKQPGFIFHSQKNTSFNSKISTMVNSAELSEQRQTNSSNFQPKNISVSETFTNFVSLVNKVTHHSKNLKCSCPRSKELPCCKQAHYWLTFINDRKGTPFNYLQGKQIYEDLTRIEEECIYEDQIKKDLHRSFPVVEFFGKDGEGIQQLERILKAFTFYDPKTGYVQGMNFIVGSLLYHSSEEIAFWLFIQLVDDYELRDVYLPGIPGLYKHSQIIDLLLFHNNPKIYLHFCHYHIKVEMFIMEWLFSLFSSVIPIQKMGKFYDNFFQEGWIFFYKFILNLLNTFESHILSEEDLGDILIPIKNKKNTDKFNKFLSGIPILNKFSGLEFWDKMLNKCKKVQINEKQVYDLLISFDPENLTFKPNRICRKKT